MDFPFGAVLALFWILHQLASGADSRAAAGAPPARPLLTRRPRPCPFCGGESDYHWELGPGGGHRLRCRNCRDVYTTNAGAETRWSISNVGGSSELCFAVQEEQAREFIENVLARIAPGVTFELRLGADEETPYCWEYFGTLKEMYEKGGLGPDAVKH